jgi:hypothetical protein
MREFLAGSFDAAFVELFAAYDVEDLSVCLQKFGLGCIIEGIIMC